MSASSAELDIDYVAKLARLDLTAEEAALFQKQLGDILRYVAKLSEVDVTGVEPATHAVPVFNVFREDDPRPSFTAVEALGNAPRQRDHLFIVPKVVE
jgi:aspartyl-tRNA(Asn)/glutamyl-tRNA(Gln) amidotransferase subunit C